MHIVQIVPELNEGGVERGTVDLSRELVRHGYSSTVISAGGRLVPQIVSDGGRHVVHDVAGKNPLTAPVRALSLRRVLRGLMPDVLHARSRVPAWLVRLAKRPLGVPWVTTVHGYNSVNRYSRVMTLGDRVICVSHGVSDFVREHYRTPKNKIRVIHRGVDLSLFDPTKVDGASVELMRGELGLRGCFVVSLVGRITSLKDHPAFIRALGQLSRDRPVRGLIVGSAQPGKAHYLQELRQLVSDLKLGDVIRFVPGTDGIAQIYAVSDVVVSSSIKPESFGRTAVEAMAMNTPVVGTNHGGMTEIILDAQNGYLVPPGEPELLAEKLRLVAGKPFGELRSHVEKHFSLEQMVDKTLAVYREVLADKGSPG